MKFMMMVHNDEPKLANLAPAEIERVVNGHAEYARALQEAGVLREGARLRPGAEMVRLKQSAGARGPRSVTDGPHAEAKEVIGGYYVIECATKEEALEWASRCPMWDSDVLELRAVWEMAD